ncbi:MAG: YraN family protein [Spirochaetes bacterium]|nr:YraN family protein [Spirochaetota bacterium]
MENRESTSAFGRTGEAEAAAFLELEGWRILARNFRAGQGEIDIVAARGDTLVFVEVKKWTRNGPGDLLDSIGRAKTRRIIETSKIFLAKYRQYRGKHIRYDVLFLPSKGEPQRYEGAFDETI